MEVQAVAMVSAVLSTRWAACKEEEEERGSRPQHMRTCSWTSWRCNRATRGWRLLRIVLPRLIALLFCMPCLCVAGHAVDGGARQSSFKFLADGLLVRDQEARPVTCHGVSTEHQKAVTEPRDEENPTELSQNSVSEKLAELLAEDDVERGGSYLQQALLGTTPQAKVSTEATIETLSLHEHCGASLSSNLTSVVLEFLTKGSSIFTVNTQFCPMDFQDAVSAGSRLSISVAHFVSLIGKAEGRMLLQIMGGCCKVEISGEGILFLCPLFVSDLEPELCGTVFLVNFLDESVSVEESCVWLEFTKEVSCPHWAKGIEGLLCRRLNLEPESSNHGRCKIKPKAEWFLAPHFSSPVMDLSVMVNHRKQVVGYLFFGIFCHSVQLFEVLVMPLEIEWDPSGTGHDMFLKKRNLADLVAVFLETGKGNGWAKIMGNPNFAPVEVTNASTQDKHHVTHITFSAEYLPSVVRVKSMVSVNNSTTNLSFQKLCSALLVYGAGRVSNVNEDRRTETLLKCPDHIICNKCLDMPSAPCNADTMVDTVLIRKNVNGPKLFHAQDLDRLHMALEYFIDLLAFAVHSTLQSNGSDLRVNFEKLRDIFALVVPIDVAELANFMEVHGNDINMIEKLISEAFDKLSPSFHKLKSICTWQRTVIECSRFAWILSSVSEILRTWCGSYLSFCMCAPEHRQCMFSRDTKSGILYTAYESNLEPSYMSSCVATYGMGVMDFENCGSECSRVFFAFKKVFVDLLKDFLQESVLENCFGVRCAPKKSIFAVLLPRICHHSLAFSRYQKLLVKLSFLIIFSVSVMLIKALRRERQLAPDYRLQHCCRHTLFFQSVYVKAGCVKVSKSSSDFELAVGGASSLKCRDGPSFENRFLIVMARVFGSLGSLFRSFFDSQATVLNVRVQISESLQTVIAEQDSNRSTNDNIADQNYLRMGLDNVKKPGNHQISTNMQEIPGNSCMENTDVLRVADLEAGSVSVPTTISTAEDASSIQLVSDLEKVQNKDKKEKGKRRRRRSNIFDAKQEPERTGRSGSSSPPSSPASPATLPANSPSSPFRLSNSSVRSPQGSTNLSGPFNTSSRDLVPRSTLIQYSSRTLLQLDVHTDHDHACNPTNRGRRQNLDPLVTKASLESFPSRMATAAKTEFCHKATVQTDARKDVSANGNWAAVARRAIVTSLDEDQCHNLSRSSSCSKNAGTRNKPVLLPSATFPQSGQSMRWNPQKLEGRNFNLNNPTSSTSLISMSLVAPDARAPGSRPHYNEKLPAVNNLPGGAGGQLEVGSTVTSHHSRMHEGPKKESFLYDIWGDHFAEISCRNQTDLSSPRSIREHGMMEMTLPPFSNDGSLFAASESRTPALTQRRADAASGHSIFMPPASFSVFSCDTFFSPYHCKNAGGSPTS